MRRIFKLTACLVAGGQSARMGQDKACIDFRGTPLWRHQLQTLVALEPDEILISGRPGADYASCGYPDVEDQFKNSGPLAGLAALVARAGHPFVLMLAVDMPFITPAYLDSLLKRCKGSCGAVPENSGFYEGLAAVFPKSALPLAEATLNNRDHSLQRFVRECMTGNLVRIIPVPEEAQPLFKSLNVPSDLLKSA